MISQTLKIVNTMKNVMKYTVILFISVLIFSCEGEDGAVGPQGEQGIQGELGPQGEQGETGTANVIYSDWIPNGFATGGGLNQKIFTLASEQEITDLGVNLDTSVVMVYARGEGVLAAIGLEAVPLPYENRSENQLYTYDISNGRIRALGVVIGGGDNDFDFFEDYRYVIIPGGQGVGQAGAKSTIDYKSMSYKEIAALFDIK